MPEKKKQPRRTNIAPMAKQAAQPTEAVQPPEEVSYPTAGSEPGKSAAEAPGSPEAHEEKFEVSYGSALMELEHRLKLARENLQSTIRELKISNEKLATSNEKILSMNEELRSTRDESASVIARDVSERKRGAAALRESEHRFRLVADAAPVLIWMSGTDKLCTWFNKPWLDFTGRTMGQELGNGWTESIHTDDHEHCLKTYTMAFDARQAFSMEYRLKRYDGEYRWILDNGVPHFGPNGEFSGYVGSCIDITERKQAEESVVATYRHLSLAMAAARIAAWTWDPHADLATRTENFQEIYGLPTVDSLEHGMSLVHPDDRRRHRQTIQSAVKHATPYHAVFRIVRPDNKQVVWLDERAVPVTDGTGRLIALSGVVVDITERKRAEDALRDREERLQAILDTAADAIITIDHHGIIRSVNAATTKMFGYAIDKLIGQSVDLLMPQTHRGTHDRYIVRYLQTGEKHIIGTSREIDAQRKDGSVFPTELAVSEIKHLKLFTGIHRDLTERKRLEREVVEAASLEQRRIGRDLHDTVAQELTALSFHANDLAGIIHSDPMSAVKMVEQMALALQRSQRELRAVLRGLLPVAVDAEGLMAALSDLVSRTHQDGKVSCTFDCPEPVSLANNLVATHLYLIAQEAVHNALKHGKPRNIRVGLYSNKDLVLQVQCDGTGMPGGSSTTEGLGLRIMRNRAAIIGASLTIEPAVPTGVLVTCALSRSNNGSEQVEDSEPRAHRRRSPGGA
jgi:PAS domain S-box-containing protein